MSSFGPMSDVEYEGKISVSAIKSLVGGRRFNDPESIYSAIVDYGEPIDPSPGSLRNSELLYGKFPEDSAVKGLVHDAAVELYSMEPGFPGIEDQRGEPLEEEEILELLKGFFTGDRRASSGFRKSLADVRKKYGLDTQDLLGYEFSPGYDTTGMLEDVASNRGESWSEDVQDVVAVDAEETWSDIGIVGRTDLVVEREDGREIWELKTKDSFSELDWLQLYAYGVIHPQPADLVLENPVDSDLRERETGDERSYGMEVTNARDDLRSLVGRFLERQEENFARDIDREEATREAVESLEVMR